MTRRTVLRLLPAVAIGPAATAEFPPTLDAGGHRLVLNGTGTRTWSPLRVAVYRAALYLPRPTGDADAILADAGPALVRARYLRRVGLEDVTAAWEASFAAICRCPLPAAFRAWLRPLAPGDEESQLFARGTVVVAGPGRPDARLDGATARTLLAAWIGPEVPPAALRRGLLGLT